MRKPHFLLCMAARLLALLLVAGAVVGAAAWWWMRAQLADALPDFAQVLANHASSETVIVSREGEAVHRLRSNDRERRGAWLALADVSPALRDAVLASEDRRFYQHGGVDWRAVLAAGWSTVWRGHRRGASTVTMQLVGLLEPSGQLRVGAGGRGLRQKLWQMVAAQVLEAHWRKDQILEAYLNLAPFRGELVGVDALARTLFDKAAHGLDQFEAAIAAALLRAPNAASVRVAQRACVLLATLDQSAAPAPRDCATLTLLTRRTLNARQWSASDGLTPHLAQRVLRGLREGRDTPERSGMPTTIPATIVTTISAPLQDYAMRSLHQHLLELRERQVEDGAVLVLDNATGDVLAWVGSSGELSAAAEVDAVTAARQPGSTLKPFLYAQAMAENRLTAASLLDDSATNLATPGGLYVPQNYDRRFQGWVSVRTALAASLNVPAVRTLVMVTPDAFFAQLQRLGLKLAETGGYHGYSLALGSAETSLLNLTNAYRALANGGRWTPVRWLPGPRSVKVAGDAAGDAADDAKPAIDPRAAFIVADILSDNLARAPTFGLDSVLATPFWSAVKTGTSKDMRDNWAVGWSQHYTVGVWVGNANGAPMHAVSGTDGAAPIWADVMGYLHRDMANQTPRRAPPAPAGVVAHAVQFGAGASGAPLEAPRREWFMAGTEQTRFAMSTLAHADGTAGSATGDATLRIVQPAHGTIFALDPDIPPAHQRVWLRARVLGRGGASNADSAANAAALSWRLHTASRSQPVGQGREVAWLPLPGRHRIELRDGEGRVLDSVQIEVRGAELRQ